MHPDLQFQAGDILVSKTRGDALSKTSLEDEMIKLGVNNLIICGYAMEFCVDSTVRRASGLGYRLQLVADAHTTMDKTHLTAEKIRQHHNITLSMAPNIEVIGHKEIHF